MAEKRDDIEVVEENNSKSTRLLVIIIAVLLVAVLGLGLYMLIGGNKQQGSEATAEQVKQPAVYYSIDDPFIVNFSEQSNNQVRYMQVKMKVMARSQTVIDMIKLHLPAIQHELLMLLYSQNYDDLQNSEGTQALQQACLETINQILNTEASLEGELEAVYFTSFIMQ